MAVPPKTDPCWKRLLTGQAVPEFSSLATKLTIGRLRRDVKQQPSNLMAAVDELRSFFAANEFAQQDLSSI